MAAHEVAMLVYRADPAAEQDRAPRVLESFGLRSAEDLPCDRPIDEPDRDFERAAPVWSLAVGAGFEPAFQVKAKRVEIPRVLRQRMRLGQRHQVEMPVGLPQILDIADQAGVAIVERLAESQGRLDS